MSKKPITDTQPQGDIPPELAPAAAELAASAREQSHALDARARTEAQIAAAAYRLLQADQAEGKQPRGWNDYLSAAAAEPSSPK